ncbi:hypothetical protein [Nocardia sp. NPDC051570]|uniref:hypothetical protein n=1 Tax=Nocardia sp. NPDC051570 TaxID=3364324 RepID=UPI003788C92A
MTRYRVFRIAHVGGHVFWWVFVVATMSVGGLTWAGYTGGEDFGWTAYAPFGEEPRRYADYVPSYGFGLHGVFSFAAFCLLVFAAVVEAVMVRRVGAGIVTVVVPFVAGALVWFALPLGHVSYSLTPDLALFVLLVGVAVREVWERRFAPGVRPD